MFDLLEAALRLSACLVGAGLVYAGGLLYEDEEKRVQSLLEDLWLKMAENGRDQLFVRSAASLSRRALDRFFGKGLLSLQTSGVGASLSIAMMLVVFAERVSAFWFLVALYLVNAILPSIWPRWKRPVVLLPFATFVFFLVPPLWEHSYGVGYILYEVLANLLFLAGPYLFVVGVARPLLRYLEKSQSLAGITLGIAASLLLVVFGLLPFFFYAWVFANLIEPASELYDIVMGNLPFFMVFFETGAPMAVFLPHALFGLTVLCASLLFLIHRLTWPLATRFVYALQKTGMLRRRKALWVVGVALASAGLEPLGRLLGTVGRLLGL